jgi:hypothetical protein
LQHFLTEQKVLEGLNLFVPPKKVRKKAPAVDLTPPASGYPAAISKGGTKVFCTTKHLQHKRCSIRKFNQSGR